MSTPTGPGNPPVANRFAKGRSGNPKGRPKSEKKRAGSAFDIVFDKSLMVAQSGRERALTVEEALQHRTYQDAIAGSRPARREILKMIAKRERYLAARQPTSVVRHEHRTEYDPHNADPALLILGIATRNPNAQDGGGAGDLLLEPWAVQAALGRRRGGQRLSEKEIAQVRQCTRDPESLRWPRSGGK